MSSCYRQTPDSEIFVHQRQLLPAYRTNGEGNNNEDKWEGRRRRTQNDLHSTPHPLPRWKENLAQGSYSLTGGILLSWIHLVYRVAYLPL